MVNFLINYLPLSNPFCEDAAIFRYGTIELHIRILFPFGFLEYCRHIQLMGVEFLAEAKLPCDNLVESENNELNIVTILLIRERATIVLVSFPTQFCGTIEVEDLKVIGPGIDKKVPRAYVAVNDT